VQDSIRIYKEQIVLNRQKIHVKIQSRRSQIRLLLKIRDYDETVSDLALD